MGHSLRKPMPSRLDEFPLVQAGAFLAPTLALGDRLHTIDEMLFRVGQIAIPRDVFEPALDIDLTPAKKYTSQSFYREVVGASLEDYVSLYYDPLNPRMKHYAFKRSRNLAERPDVDFVNVELDALKQIAMKSIMANEPVWFAADVGKDQSSKLGLMAMNLFNYGPLFDVDRKSVV